MKAVIKLYQLFRNPRLLTLLCSSLLVSCGDPLTTAGIGGTGISYGTVTDFGSIIINGRYLDDLSATVTLDDIEGIGDHGGLKQGMVVKVNGIFSGNTGTATSIEYRDNLEGEVCAITSEGGIITLRVLGQTVIMDATTIVDGGATIDSITVGDIVEVSGLPDKDGQIHASFIQVKNSGDEVIEVKGRVSNLTGSSTFTINALEVNFSSIGVIDGVLADGQFVEVKGAFTCGSSSPDTLIATSVELEPEGAGDIPAGAHIEVEGFVTQLTLDGFKVGSQQIEITGITRYLPEGFFNTDIIVGTKVEAEGTYDNGVLSATKIVFWENVRLESEVAIVNGSSFTLVGLTNIIITTNSATEPPGVTVTPGNHIRVRGVEGPNDTVLATRIDDKSGDIDAFVQGSVQSKEGTVITVLGIDFDTNSISEFEDVNEIPISQATFLSLVEPGTLVKFQGEIAVSTITYLEAELEDD